MGKDKFFPPLRKRSYPKDNTFREPDKKSDYCTVVFKTKMPGRFPTDSVEIPNVPLIDASYDGFKIAMQMGGFYEVRPEGYWINPSESDDPNTLGISIPGDFKRFSAVSQQELKDGKIEFPGEPFDHYFGQMLGWSNYVIFTQDLEKDKDKYILADLNIKLYKVLKQYPLQRITSNRYSRYLKTR